MCAAGAHYFYAGKEGQHESRYITRYRFGYSHTPVLDGVSLEIKSGEFVGITGERRVKIDADESHARHAQTLGRNYEISKTQPENA